MGVHGMSERAGFTTPNLLEADTNRAFVDATEHLVVLADHTKWNVTGLSTFASLDDADELITDANLPLAARRVLEEHVGRLLLTDAQFSDPFVGANVAEATPRSATRPVTRKRA
jgi:DeoR family transcriptional regulator, fructose operon transcriptional repressor